MTKRTILLLAISAAVLPSPRGTCLAAEAVTTAPVDYALYREGEVQRNERRYGGWLLTCDEIRRLGRKFCSLRTVARSADGTIVAAMTVSTDDRGQPAAVITLPYGSALASGVRVAYGEADRRSGATTRTTPSPVGCGGLGCQIVWPLRPDDIRELRAGHALRMDFSMRSGATTFPGLAVPAMRSVAGRVEGAGFADALSASLR